MTQLHHSIALSKGPTPQIPIQPHSLLPYSQWLGTASTLSALQWLDNENMVHIHYGMLFSCNKK